MAVEAIIICNKLRMDKLEVSMAFVMRLEEVSTKYFGYIINTIRAIHALYWIHLPDRVTIHIDDDNRRRIYKIFTESPRGFAAHMNIYI